MINSPDRLIKNVLQIPLCERRTLHVLVCLDVFCDLDSLLVLNRRHLLLAQVLPCAFVIPQVQLCADEDDWNIGRMVLDFWIPLEVHQSEFEVDASICRTLALTLSNDGGETMEKQMRKTSVCGYERGRSLS